MHKHVYFYNSLKKLLNPKQDFMNKVFPVISILLLIAAGYELLKINTLTEENSSLKEQVTTSKQSGCDVCAPSTTGSVFTMDVNTLKHMRHEYISNMPNATSQTDATAVWFTLDDIKNFILEVQKDTCGKSCNSKLGIRIYYARYPTSISTLSTQFPGYNGVNPNYGGYQTVFMVPTIDVNGNHKDFNPLDKNHSICDTSAINFEGPNRGTIRVLAGKNHGELCPPVCSLTPPTGYAAFY